MLLELVATFELLVATFDELVEMLVLFV